MRESRENCEYCYFNVGLIFQNKNKVCTKSLILHVGNCSGQNRKLFVLFHIDCHVFMGFDKNVTLYFLVGFIGLVFLHDFI